MLKRDLTGERFGKLEVIKFSGRAKDGHALWLCKCDCGNMKIAQGNNLVSGNTTNCGCVNQEKYDSLMIGRRFGKLTVIGRDTNKGQKRIWRCRCECGKETLVSTDKLNSGNTRSCGCTRVDKLNEFSTKHGGKRKDHAERLYGVWRNMLSRCYDESSKQYARYGGRGIIVCEEWRSDYASFREWSVANGYNPDSKKGVCTLDRTDNNGNYCPENCRWVNLKEQANNKRNNHYLLVNGERITTSEASEKYGIPYRRLLNRLNRGWSDEEAVLTGKRVNQWG